VATKFLTVPQSTKRLAVERIICGSSIWNFHYVTLLPTEILMWILDFLENLCDPGLRDVQNRRESRYCTGNVQNLISDLQETSHEYLVHKENLTANKCHVPCNRHWFLGFSPLCKIQTWWGHIRPATAHTYHWQLIRFFD
jgi:hypothetical protein